MPATGGRMPFDASGALAGPARTVFADPADVAASPVDLWQIITPVANVTGEYPVKTGWKDFGLAADAPTYTHSKETEGLEYQQSRGVLFEQISNIARSFTAQVAQIDPDNMVIVENAQAVETIAGATGVSAQKKVSFGIYEEFKTLRIALISYRPSGTPMVTEPAPSNRKRPAAVALILPLCVLAAEDSEFQFDAGNPVNAPITFTVLRDATQAAGKEHGYWIFEQPGVIAP